MKRFILFTIIAFLLVLPNTFAQWSNDPIINTPICVANNNQESASIVSDGSGGAIIVWRDLRDETIGDIYSQRIDGLGFTQWALNGIPVQTLNTQYYPQCVSDGSGGVISIWEE